MDGHRVDASRPDLLIRRSAVFGSALILAAAGTAQAGDDPKVGAGKCKVVMFCVGVSTDGKSGGERPQTGSQDGGGSDLKCGYTKIDPKPPASAKELWKGADPKKNDLYFYSCSDGGQNNPDGFVAVPTGQQPRQQANPEELAQQAVDSMTLLGPAIHINPKPGGQGLVGMPVWMAVDQSPTTWGPNTATASAGGVTVTATAKVSKIVWSMGDGSTVTCTTPGTVYQKSYGLRKSPDCGHVYTEPSTAVSGGTYKVTATSTWVIDWNGGGTNGQLTEVRNSSVAVTIVESQAVNS
ncbi:ATP/GTP-binding protein [Streptomyces sp. RP5T]|uniref:ATP/GTP-binding protein n=1 Tax=Streptomyces sp. RP5T TaxID=2490848 RepID=UPI000F64B35B|nr:ATP/GTP-binding protein [Streptomyces sp. RP5T]RRR87021.1 ATP/GTP-binding protein [Streptomyces sp. RP5T]